MTKFKIGDIVTGTKNNDYGVTNKDGIYEVTSVSKEGEYIDIKVISHKTKNFEVGKIFPGLDAELFELVESKEKESASTKKGASTKTSDNIDANLALNKLDKMIDVLTNLSKNINTRTLYDDSVQEIFLNKAKDISIKELQKQLIENTEKYIQKEYGNLPKTIEVKVENKQPRTITGIFHKEFENILKLVQADIPVMLVGGAGGGKNHTLEQVANALGLDFYFTSEVNQEYKLTGFIDANGNYQETQFYKAFTNGGLFFFDEMDASSPDALVTFNGALANGYFDFPNGKVYKNKDFRVVCASNTNGTGADAIYTGRNALDGATLDRFITIKFDYDSNVESQLAYDKELFDFIVKLRETVNTNQLRFIVSMRATINATKMLNIGMDKKYILKNAILKTLNNDDLNIIKPYFENDTNEWAKLLRAL